jgi:acetyl esterase
MDEARPQPRLTPAITAFVEAALAQLGAPAPASLEEQRRGAKALRAPWNEGGPAMAATLDRTLAGRPARRHVPPGARGAPVLFLHGGGWALLDLDTHDRIVRAIARAAGRPFEMLDYDRAPEARFPAAVEQCVAAFLALAEEMPGVALAGDSAGANLAAATALALRDRGGPLPSALALAYGVFDCDFATDSYRRWGDGRLPLSAERMRWFWDLYCPDAGQRRNPLAAPLGADLRGLPPTHLTVAQHDVLYDENLRFAARLGAAGVDVALRVYPGTVHGFLEAAGAVGAPEAEAALAEIGAFLGGRA